MGSVTVPLPEKNFQGIAPFKPSTLFIQTLRFFLLPKIEPETFIDYSPDTRQTNLSEHIFDFLHNIRKS